MQGTANGTESGLGAARILNTDPGSWEMPTSFDPH